MRKIAISVLGALLVFGVIPTVLAADQGTGCPTDPERVRFYENTIADNSDGDDTVIFCGLGASDLSQISHTVSGQCKSNGIRFDDSWNDCISSLYPVVPVGRVLCLYGGANFTGGSSVPITHGSALNGMRTNLSSYWQDGISSWHFLNDGPQFLGCGG
jgi:hypothetical protein